MEPDKFLRRIREAQQYLGKTMHHAGTTPVAIENPRRRTALKSPDWLRSRGEFLDMSAYASALEATPDGDVTIFINDTLFMRHPWRLALRRLADLLPSLETSVHAAAAGEVHATTDVLLVDRDNPSRRHLSTFCFAVNADARRKLSETLLEMPVSSTSASVREWVDGQIDRHPALATLLHVHLFGPKNPWTWPGKANDASEDLLLRKAVTVIAEYRFTSGLLSSGGLLMPINLGPAYKVASRWCRLFGR
jgi:hypothetical protein